MTTADWLMIIAVLLAPLFAIQVQKYMERYREGHNRKIYVFKTLMATRAATISAEHVQALNMIDLEFHEIKYTRVREAWKNYLDHLGHYPNDDEKKQPLWSETRSNFLAKLLKEMGQSLGYHFDNVHIKRGIYLPEGHTLIEDEQKLIRSGILRLLYGDANLKMDVVSLPTNEQEIKRTKQT